VTLKGGKSKHLANKGYNLTKSFYTAKALEWNQGPQDD
jgi:hypothetical protein